MEAVPDPAPPRRFGVAAVRRFGVEPVRASVSESVRVPVSVPPARRRGGAGEGPGLRLLRRADGVLPPASGPGAPVRVPHPPPLRCVGVGLVLPMFRGFAGGPALLRTPGPGVVPAPVPVPEPSRRGGTQLPPAPLAPPARGPHGAVGPGAGGVPIG
ncbi:hypothetical protein GCM10010228_22610 [Streptomyces massasporeus]|nr:hypothetical protein GCM10010228_22610 [Streptomyces massasporeus]